MAIEILLKVAILHAFSNAITDRYFSGVHLLTMVKVKTPIFIEYARGVVLHLRKFYGWKVLLSCVFLYNCSVLWVCFCVTDQ